MAKHSDRWSDELCGDHWADDDLLKPGTLECISRWHELWAHQPPRWRQFLASINPYSRDSIESFSIKPLVPGPAGRTRVVYINGLFGQADAQFHDWIEAGKSLFPGLMTYGLRWESRRVGSKREIVGLLGEQAMLPYKTFGVSLIASWHATAMKAADTGRLLAQVLMRAKGQQFVLCGHSLGARVIFYALQELSKCGRMDVVKTANLMGGAVGIGDVAAWTHAIAACPGGVTNYFSKNDDVLKYLYIPAMGFKSDPIGRNPLDLRGVRNIDVTDKIGGHTQYKDKFADFARYPLGI
jgi:pimeloyl-ACP methyl ester carboxylesterase